MPKVRLVLSYGFGSKINTSFSGAKSYKNRLRFEKKVTVSLKVGTFYETQYSV